MFLDKSHEMSDSQAVTASAASTNVIDLGPVHLSQSYGGDAELLLRVKEAVTAAGAATVNFKLETASDEAFSSPVVLAESGAIGKAALTLNSEHLKIKVPSGADRYLRVYYEVATGPLTAGKFYAALAMSRQTNK